MNDGNAGDCMAPRLENMLDHCAGLDKFTMLPSFRLVQLQHQPVVGFSELLPRSICGSSAWPFPRWSFARSHNLIPERKHVVMQKRSEMNKSHRRTRSLIAPRPSLVSSAPSRAPFHPRPCGSFPFSASSSYPHQQLRSPPRSDTSGRLPFLPKSRRVQPKPAGSVDLAISPFRMSELGRLGDF